MQTREKFGRILKLRLTATAAVSLHERCRIVPNSLLDVFIRLFADKVATYFICFTKLKLSKWYPISSLCLQIFIRWRSRTLWNPDLGKVHLNWSFFVSTAFLFRQHRRHMITIRSTNSHNVSRLQPRNNPMLPPTSAEKWRKQTDSECKGRG